MIDGGVRPLAASDEDSLTAFLETLAGDSDAVRQFHPHPLDRASARRVAAESGEDLYFAYFIGELILGYGMLRGWDEGYEVPSLGVAVLPSFRSRGVGTALLSFAVKQAANRGAQEIMLKVEPGNLVARHWYASVGFLETGTADDGQVVCRRPLLPSAHKQMGN